MKNQHFLTYSIFIFLFISIVGCEKDDLSSNPGGKGLPSDTTAKNSAACDIAHSYLDSIEANEYSACNQVWAFQGQWYAYKCDCDAGLASEPEAANYANMLNSVRDLILTMYQTGGEGPYTECGEVPPIITSCKVTPPTTEQSNCGTTETKVFDVYNPITGRTWMDRNLGASRAATSSQDTEAYGALYQWGRLSDGHECHDSEVTSEISNTDVPGHDNFIIANYQESYNNWQKPSNDNLWQGVNGKNNPCPSGYRIPTYDEWQAEMNSWSSEGEEGAFQSPLKLTVAGYRSSAGAVIGGMDYEGRYWSSDLAPSDQNEKRGSQLRFGTNSYGDGFAFVEQGVRGSVRAGGLSIRCIKN